MFRERAIEKIGKKKPYVVEVASNDGTFLEQFQKIGCKVIGVDPATNIARVVNAPASQLARVIQAYADKC